MHLKLLRLVCCSAILAGLCQPVGADEIIFESGTLGTTGIAIDEIVGDPAPGGAVVSPFVFDGVRFQVNSPVRTTRIGGHFVDDPNTDASFFGAIVRLDSASDFPDSGDFFTDDLVGFTSLTFPDPSDEVFGDIDVRLEPSWYALVFGSGLFGTTGSGGALLNNTDIGAPTYIAHQPGVNWFDISPPEGPFENYRLVLEGSEVPEPTVSILLVTLVVVCLSFRFLFHDDDWRNINSRRKRSSLRSRVLRFESVESRRMLTTFVVNSMLDDGTDTTLRDAISFSNQSQDPSGDIIKFDENVFSNGGTINLTQGQLSINETTSLTIDGTDAQGNSLGITVTTAGNPRAFDINGNGLNGQVEFIGFTITGSGSLAGTDKTGGAIQSSGILALRNMTLTGNTGFRGGAVYVKMADDGANDRTVLTVIDSIITNNTAYDGGGGLYLQGGTECLHALAA